MNKQEIEHKLEQAQKDRMGINDNIQWLKEQLAEAEKPKLRHGDFGYCDEPCYPRIVLNDGKLATAFRVIDDNEVDRPTVIFGNIFKMTEGWGEDFGSVWASEKSINGERRIWVDVISDVIWLGTSGDSRTYSHEVAYEIWRNLGHALMTLKKKQ